MKLKKLFLFVMILPLLGLFFSCHNTREDEIAQLPYVNFENNVEELNFIKAGETKKINIESSREWKVMNVPEWVSVSPEKGKGNQELTIIVSPNSGAKRQAKIAVNLTQATGYLVNLNIVQEGEGGAEPGGGDALYFEDFGTKVEKVENKWPWVDQYTGWSRKGSLAQADVVYAGKGASVRNSGPKYDPTGENPGSAPYGYWGRAADYFQIEKINVTGNSNLTLQFYAQHQSAYSGSPVFSPITAATLKVYAGFDGENWAELPISSDGEAGWSFVKSEFKIPEGQATIYLKFSDFIGEKDNQFRIDDISILAGGNGELINPGGDTPTPPPSDDVDALYFEDFGTKVEKDGKYWPYIDKFHGWSRKGTLSQSDVTYGGKGASVRKSGPKYAPSGENPGGEPYGYWSKSADYFQIEKINVTGNANLTLQFYAQHQSAYSGAAVFSPITATTLKVYAGFDGENWAELPISSDGVAGWSLVKSEFKIPEGQSTIYLKFSDFIGEKDNQFRIDDISILAGGAGELINPDGGSPTPPPSGDAVQKTISEIRAHQKGGATAPEAGWFIEGVVVSDKDGKNIQEYQIALADNTTENSGLMFNYKKNEPNPNFAIGDKVKIVLNGTKYKEYNKLLQVIDIKSDNVSLISSSNVVEPVLITAAQLLSGKYESMLVAVDNTELVDKSNSALIMNGNIKVKSEGSEFIMRTAKDAVFKAETAPMGKGKLIGIAGVFNADIQVLPRSANDFSGMLEGGGTTPPPSGDAVQKTISEIRAHQKGGAPTPEAGWYVEGLVVSDKDGKNTHVSQIVVVDNTTVNSGLVFRYATGQTNPNFSVGDKVKILLNESKYGEFKKLIQVSDIKSDNVSLISSSNAIEPVLITATQLLSGKYESMLVAVDNTELVDKTNPALTMNGEKKVKSEGTEFIMYTGSKAVFKDKPIPLGKGKLIGLAAVYETKIQILPRNEADFAGMVATGGTTPPPTLAVDAAAVNVTATGGEKIINLTTTPADLAWTAVLVDGATVTPTISPATGNGSAAIKVSFPENSDKNTKTATIKLSAEGASDVNVVFTQAKKETEPTPSPDAQNFPAIWDFNTASLEDGLIKATEGNTNATIGVLGATNFEIAGGKNKKYATAKAWKKNETAWVIKVPVTNLVANTTIVLDFEQASSNTGPRDFVAEYSTDNGSSWTVCKGLKPMLPKANPVEQKIEMPIATAVNSGNLIIRLRVSTNKNAKGTGDFEKGGTSRLSGGKFSITLK